ncbi:MAG: porin [Verrucomicrobiota bacterium]
MILALTSQRSRLKGALLIALVAGRIFTHSVFADESADRINALEKLIEAQNQKIDALTEKVKLLEQREQGRTNNVSSRQLPTIVIDTNGVPITPAATGGDQPEPGLSGEATKQLPQIIVGSDGFLMRSADTNFVLRLRGLVQLDSRTFFDDNTYSEGNDSFVLRRARPIIEGTVFKDFDFQLAPDFGGSSVQIFDAWINYRYRPELQLRAGKFKGPVGFENLQSDATLPFNERSLVSALVPVRNVGVQLWGDVAGGVMSYAAGVFNGAGDSRNPSTTDFADHKEVAGKIALQPFKQSSFSGLRGLGFGVGGSYSQVSSNAQALPNTTGGAVPGYTTSALQQFFAYNPRIGPVVGDGAHWRISPYIYYLRGPFGLLGEHAISHQGVLNSATLLKAELEHTAWQVSAQWVLTGEPASFSGIVPLHPFNLTSGGWGAWQLVARYGQLDIDAAAFHGFSNPAVSASSATSWSVGINWWLNKNVRVLMSYAHTGFDGGGGFNPVDPITLLPPAIVTQQDENVFFTRFQLAF